MLRHGRFDVDDVSMTTPCVMVMFMDMLVPTSVAIAIVVTTVTGAGLVATVIDRRRPAVLRGRGRVIPRRCVIWRSVRVYVIHDVITGSRAIVTCSGWCGWWWRHLPTTGNHLRGRSEVARVMTVDMVGGYYGTEPVTFAQAIYSECTDDGATEQCRDQYTE